MSNTTNKFKVSYTTKNTDGFLTEKYMNFNSFIDAVNYIRKVNKGHFGHFPIGKPVVETVI